MEPDSPLRELYLEHTGPGPLGLDEVRHRDRRHRVLEAGAVVVIGAGAVVYAWQGTPTDLLVALLLSAFLVVAATRSRPRIDQAELESPGAYVEELSARNLRATALWQPLWPLLAAAVVIVAVNLPPLLSGDGAHWYVALVAQVAVWSGALWGRRRKLRLLELEARTIDALKAELDDAP